MMPATAIVNCGDKWLQTEEESATQLGVDSTRENECMTKAFSHHVAKSEDALREVANAH